MAIIKIIKFVIYIYYSFNIVWEVMDQVMVVTVVSVDTDAVTV